MSEILDENFRHIRDLARDIEEKLNGTSSTEQRLRNEIAGMFAVTIAASYEGIVKETLVSYAGNFHPKYRSHIEKDFDRLNGRISLDDLKAYSRRFGLTEWVGHKVKKNSTTFHKILEQRKTIVERRFRTDLITSYENIFTWRHAYAHERATVATFSDVYKAHRVAQYVIRSFVKAFELG
ncbi:HEPN domain-containing protein [Agrobacterium sp. ES01]|uniref:HEPN domain-containing protein n=1 Tax=Agrobacterium sp. ES01 TaxID=3420714 RepID=UPI003D0F0BE6